MASCPTSNKYPIIGLKYDKFIPQKRTVKFISLLRSLIFLGIHYAINITLLMEFLKLYHHYILKS